METLQFNLESTGSVAATAPVLVGVVSSGNLEVLIESDPEQAGCRVEITTGAIGFETIWAAVLADFIERHPVGGLRISMNDQGASPAIVALRLDQAIEEFLGTSL